MNKRERVMKTLRGEITDRPPITAYRHFPKQERDPKELAETMLNFHHKYDWDILKVHPSATYMQEVWGVEFDFENYRDGIFPTRISPVDETHDLSIFVEKDIDTPVLKDHIESMRLMKEGIKDDAPILYTLFTPLSILTGVFGFPMVRRHFPADRNDDPIFDLMENRKEELLEALSNITETYINFWKGLKEAGADGLFLAGVSWARDGYATEEEWRTFVEPFDKRITEAIQEDGGIVMYHTCGIKSNPQRFVDYNIDILHWDQGAENNPSIKEAYEFLKPVTPMGGVDEMLFGNDEEVKIARQAEEAIKENKDIPFILAPYCSVSVQSSDKELRAFRDSVEK